MLTDFYAYLAGDATLRGLIAGATILDPRIYPEEAPPDTAAPYLIFGPVSEGSMEEVMDKMTIQVSVFVGEFDQVAANNIINRLKAMLDKQDELSIPSTTHRIFWGKHVGGVSNFAEKPREYHRAAMFAFKFKLK